MQRENTKIACENSSLIKQLIQEIRIQAKHFNFTKIRASRGNCIASPKLNNTFEDKQNSLCRYVCKRGENFT